MRGASLTRLPVPVSLTLLLACGGEPDQPIVGLQAHSFANFEWSAPVNLGPPINTAFVENNAELSPDGLSLYFGSNRPGGFGLVDIWVSRRACRDCSWEEPVNLGPIINSSAGDAGPGLPRDGHLLFLSSDRRTRPGGPGEPDMWVSTRGNVHDPWSPPVLFEGPLNTAFLDQQANLASNGRTLLFTSLRPGGQGVQDIWMSTRTPSGN
jgi:WD40-like Beta Propeller Repeat